MRIGRNFAIWDRCQCGWEECDEREFVWIVTRPFQLRWFADAGEWFLYLHIGRKWWRWCSAGYLSGREKLKWDSGVYQYTYTFIGADGKPIQADGGDKDEH